MSQEFNVLIRGISPGAIGLFVLMIPKLKEGDPYGFYHGSSESIGSELKIHSIIVGRYMKELKNRNLIRSNRRGMIYSPLVIKRII